MAQRTMRKIAPIHPDKKRPPSAVDAGFTEDGRPLLRETTVRVESEPAVDEEGNELYRKNQSTGEPMYKLRRGKRVRKERLFTLVSEGNGNVRREEYIPPTPEEIERRRQQKATEELLPNLAKILADRGLTPEQLADRLAGPATPAASVPEPESPASYPEHLGGGTWLFSDGTKESGLKKEDAVKLEEEKAGATG